MKTITYILIFILSTSFVNQPNNNDKTIIISPKSELNIVGSSNVSDFQCLFEFQNRNQALPVNFEETKGEIHFNRATLVLKNSNFDCGGRAINKDFHALLKTEKHPQIFLSLKKIKRKPNTKNVVEALVEIKIAGKSKHYTLNAKVNQKDELNILGNLKLNINDFNLEAPKKMMGLIVVSEKIEINFNLVIEEKNSYLANYLK